MIADFLLAAAALGAGLYCVVLARRLTALGSLESGMGSAIAILSKQVDDLSRSLKAAQEAAQRTQGTLGTQTERAESAARRLELLVASLHDLPEIDPAEAPRPGPAAMRPPTPWPQHAARPDETIDERSPPDGQPRARILRRRQGPGAL